MIRIKDEKAVQGLLSKDNYVNVCLKKKKGLQKMILTEPELIWKVIP